ncbi:hypothetical protein RKD48_000386 [Streptomyces ambofaciens]
MPPALAGQETPRALVRLAGTRTLYSLPSRYRKGFSREIGVVSSVVYGPVSKLLPGAPSTPVNVMFQTPLVQPPTELSRVYHCCWE